jgi:hypothetical protein
MQGAGPGRSDGTCEAKLAACEAQVAVLRGALSSAGGNEDDDEALEARKHVDAVVNPGATREAIRAAAVFLKGTGIADAKRCVMLMKAAIDPLLQQEGAYEKYALIMDTKAWGELVQQEADAQSTKKIQGLLEARDDSAVKAWARAKLLEAAASDVTIFPFMSLLLLVDESSLLDTIMRMTPHEAASALGSIVHTSLDERAALFRVVARAVSYTTEPELAKAVAKLALNPSKGNRAELLRGLFGKMEAPAIVNKGKSQVKPTQYTKLMMLASDAEVRLEGERIAELSAAEGKRAVQLDSLIKGLGEDKIKPYLRKVFTTGSQAQDFTKQAVDAIKKAGYTIEQAQEANNVDLPASMPEDANMLKTDTLVSALVSALFKDIKGAAAPAPGNATVVRPKIVLTGNVMPAAPADFMANLSKALASRQPQQLAQPEEANAKNRPPPPPPPPRPLANAQAKGGAPPPGVPDLADLLKGRGALKKVEPRFGRGPDKGALFAELAQAVARRRKRRRFGHGATRHV